MDNLIEFLQSTSSNLKYTYDKNMFKIMDTKKKIFELGFDIDNSNLILDPGNKNIENIHLHGILKKNGLANININDIVELGTFFDSKLDNITNYCSCCYKSMDYQSDTYITCGKEKCNYQFEELLIGDPVLKLVKDDSDMFCFLIESAFDAATCQRKYDIFEPFPEYFMKSSSSNIKKNRIKNNLSKLGGEDYDNLKNFLLIEKVIEKINEFKIGKLIEEIQFMSSDAQIIKMFGEEIYRLIRFIIMSCKVELVLDTNFFQKEINGVKVYKIYYPTDKEESFKKKCDKIKNKETNSYIFHGSRWQNWYSILRNGLKNCSRTKLMTSGAAHGNGIYLSDNSNLSIGYGTSAGKSVIGVFETVGDKKMYHKGGNIFVIDDETMLIQRYLIISKTNQTNKISAELDNIIGKQIQHENSKVESLTLNKGIKKLIREYKKISKQKPEDLGFRIIVDDKNIYHWNIFIFGYDPQYPIGEDMKKYGINEIQLEVKFPTNYPFSPPFIRIISPRFKSQTGHVTQAGALCMEILTEKNWSAACSIESLIITIKSEIIEGDGRLDPVNYNLPYSENEAKESFIRVARGHGWL